MRAKIADEVVQKYGFPVGREVAHQAGITLPIFLRGNRRAVRAALEPPCDREATAVRQDLQGSQALCASRLWKPTLSTGFPWDFTRKYLVLSQPYFSVIFTVNVNRQWL
jgi:hypothetical protein